MTASNEIRTCIGSGRFGIEAHDSTADQFPVQPSQRDGLGRMCKVHWNRYTAGLARDAKARKAAAAQVADTPDEAEVLPNAGAEAPADVEPLAVVAAPRRGRRITRQPVAAGVDGSDD